MAVKIYLILVNIILVNNIVNAQNAAFDPSLYESALDPALCASQLALIRNETLLYLQFIESGLRIPRSILSGNIVDLGNYHQCLAIRQDTDDSRIEGKYCTINVPINQELNLPSLPEWPDLPDGIEWPDIDWPEWITLPRKLRQNQQSVEKLKLSRNIHFGGIPALGDTNDAISRSAILEEFGDYNIDFTLAVCVPKACTTREGINGLLFNSTAMGLEFRDRSCRLRNDKPWVPADYVAIVIFSILLIVTILSTSYDLYYTFIVKRDPKTLSTWGRSFSVYTNARRLTTFNKNPGALECVDGIRAIAMLWVIVGHTFYTLPVVMNNFDALDWQTSFRSIWITAAPITVDTFFMLSGLLLVYTTAGKLTGSRLLRSLHLFYLNRILRMFPLLAAAVLLQASYFHRSSDGPMWETVARNTENCRTNWWTTLLYVQNYVSRNRLCLGQTWYLAVDMQLHIISPIVLYWVLSHNKRTAWITLAATTLTCLTVATTYIFLMELPGSIIAPARIAESGAYARYYYFNTLTRAAPFFVGMIFGYIMHTYRERKLLLSKATASLLWICAATMIAVAVCATEPMKSLDWDNQTVDSLVNSFIRPIWALGLGWLIFACVHGYGGPINWILSLSLWKLPSRISYAMYLFHFPIMYAISGTVIAPIYFSVSSTLYKFYSQLAISFLVGFIATLLIDSPFSTVFKLLLGGGAKRPPRKEIEIVETVKPVNTEVYKL